MSIKSSFHLTFVCVFRKKCVRVPDKRDIYIIFFLLILTTYFMVTHQMRLAEELIISTTTYVFMEK